MHKNKYFNSDNAIKILFSLSLFFIIKTYNNIDKNIDDLKNSMVENNKKLYLLEFKYISLKESIKKLENKKN